MTEPFHLGDAEVLPGARRSVALPLASLPDHTPLTLNVEVIHGARPGPTLFVSAVIHGDEVIGLEVIRRLLRAPALSELAGTLLAIPLVNVIGFLSHSRYLPDRRDLNRCFPGSPNGPLGERMAWLFSKEIIERADVGIDIHSASNHRVNLPQIRVDSLADEPRRLATAFGAPVVLHTSLRTGSLRAAARAQDKTVLLYEAGEALRFDEQSVRVGVSGVLAVMASLGMVPSGPEASSAYAPVIVKRSYWERAPEGGVFRAYKALGDGVGAGEDLGVVSDPVGDYERPVTARRHGLIIGRSVLPVVNRGDALFHIGETANPDDAEAVAAARDEVAAAETLFDEDEIV